MREKKNNRKNFSEMQLYEELVTHIYKDLYKFIYVIVRNVQMAEDVLQETMLKGYKHFDELREKDKFKTWIFTIAKREALGLLKKSCREVVIDREECNNIIELGVECSGEFEDTPEIYEVLADIINNLDTESKDIINLIYYSGLSLEEVAAALNMNCNTVKSRHRRLKEKIYNKLAEKKYARKSK